MADGPWDQVGKERTPANDPPILRRPGIVPKDAAGDFNDYHLSRSDGRGGANEYEMTPPSNNNNVYDAKGSGPGHGSNGARGWPEGVEVWAAKEGIKNVGQGILGDGPADATDVARQKATQSLADAEPRIPGTDFPASAGEGAAGKAIPAEADVLAGKAGSGIKAFLTGDGELITVKNGQAVATKAPKLAQLLDEAHDAMTATKGFANKYLAQGAQEMASMGSKGGILDAAGGMAGKVGEAALSGARMLDAPMLAALIGFSPTEANAGEDKVMDQRNAAAAAPGALGDQTVAAMDKGVNTAQAPTKNTKADNTPQTDIGKSMPKAATMKDDVTGKKGGGAPSSNGNTQAGTQTKGGFFPQYNKGSAEAGDFRQAFASAVTSGAATFNWQGREYSTQVAK